MAIKGLKPQASLPEKGDTSVSPYSKPFNNQEGFVTGEKATTQHTLTRNPETEQIGAEATCKGYYTRQIRKFRIGGESKYVLNNCYQPVTTAEVKLWDHYVKMKMAEKR